MGSRKKEKKSATKGANRTENTGKTLVFRDLGELARAFDSKIYGTAALAYVPINNTER